jgi:hypothetical protein
MIKVYSRDRKEFGMPTGSSTVCKLEGCRGRRIGVRWRDGKITFPCTHGMKIYKNGNMRIL